MRKSGNTLRCVAISALVMLAAGCGNGPLAPEMNEGPWPPAAPKSPPADFAPDDLSFSRTGMRTANGDFIPLPGMFYFESDGWVKPHLDEEFSLPEYESTFIGMAMTVKEQDFVLERNLFTMPVRTDRFLPTEFVVLSYANDMTAIRLRPDSEDRFAFFETRSIDGNRDVRVLDFDSLMPGARAHVGGNIYLLRADGWYAGDEKVGEITPLPEATRS